MLSIKNFCVKYKKGKDFSARDVSFDVKKGEIVAVLGPSGCGKTTTLKVIAGLLDEKDIEKTGEILWNENGKKPEIRMVFQLATLLPWRTVEKNIAFGLEIKKFSKEEISQKVQEAIKLVGLQGFEKYYPAKLSVGMQQRVNFARALVCEPDLLLLDEPFSALDVNSKKKLQKDFLKIISEKKITAIFVTHSIEEALEMGDKIYVFFDGKNLKKGYYENNFKESKKHSIYINLEDYLEKA